MKTLIVDRRIKDFLTDTEIDQFLASARMGARGEMYHLLRLMAYRHGIRASQLIDARLREVDLKVPPLRLCRLKGRLTAEHLIESDEPLGSASAYCSIHSVCRSSRNIQLEEPASKKGTGAHRRIAAAARG